MTTLELTQQLEYPKNRYYKVTLRSFGQTPGQFQLLAESNVLGNIIFKLEESQLFATMQIQLAQWLKYNNIGNTIIDALQKYIEVNSIVATSIKITANPVTAKYFFDAGFRIIPEHDIKNLYQHYLESSKIKDSYLSFMQLHDKYKDIKILTDEQANEFREHKFFPTIKDLAIRFIPDKDWRKKLPLVNVDDLSTEQIIMLVKNIKLTSSRNELLGSGGELGGSTAEIDGIHMLISMQDFLQYYNKLFSIDEDVAENLVAAEDVLASLDQSAVSREVLSTQQVAEKVNKEEVSEKEGKTEKTEKIEKAEKAVEETSAAPKIVQDTSNTQGVSREEIVALKLQIDDLKEKLVRAEAENALVRERVAVLESKVPMHYTTHSSSSEQPLTKEQPTKDQPTAKQPSPAAKALAERRKEREDRDAKKKKETEDLVKEFKQLARHSKLSLGI